jgi:hypothetical protein
LMPAFSRERDVAATWARAQVLLKWPIGSKLVRALIAVRLGMCWPPAG